MELLQHSATLMGLVGPGLFALLAALQNAFPRLQGYLPFVGLPLAFLLVVCAVKGRPQEFADVNYFQSIFYAAAILGGASLTKEFSVLLRSRWVK